MNLVCSPPSQKCVHEWECDQPFWLLSIDGACSLRVEKCALPVTLAVACVTDTTSSEEANGKAGESEIAAAKGWRGNWRGAAATHRNENVSHSIKWIL